MGDKLKLYEPVRRRKVGDRYDLVVASVDDHDGRAIVCIDDIIGQTVILHFIRKPGEADELFDEADEVMCAQMFAPGPSGEALFQ